MNAVTLAALDAVNKIRASFNVAPIKRLPRGTLKESTSCPVANALHDFDPTARIGNSMSTIGGVSRETPPEIGAFVTAFDRGDIPELAAL